ncbi:hypothetical protein BsWGS_27878 [Bradybaena similaris]
MVPPGVHTFSGMKISSIHLSTSSTTNPFSRASLSPEKWILSSQLSSIFRDHAYVLKSHGGDTADDTSWSNGRNQSTAGAGDDHVFSSKIDGFRNITESGDVDFLKGLDELDFDLDPDDDVEMADSFQDFIDSALEDSCYSFLTDRLTGGSSQQSHQGNGDIGKEEFLSSLCLRSAQVKASNSDLTSSLDERAPNTTCSVQAADQDTQLLDQVPTKRCSCMASEAAPRAVYSMAQVSQPVCTSPSTLVTNSKDSACSNCLQTRLTSDRPMSPLFIDTSFSECPQSLQSFSGDSVSAASETTHDPSDSDNDATDVMKWLSESQQSGDVYTDSLNWESDNKVFVLPDKPSCSLDLESFVDLDDYLDEDLPQQITPGCPCDHSPLYPATKDHSPLHPVTKDHSPLHPVIKDALIMSPLRLSFLEEQQDRKRCSSFGFHPHLSVSSNISHDARSSEASNMSPWNSPAWSVTDSSQLSPLGSTNLSGPAAPDSVFEDSSLKGQLDLLKLFSEDNVESLLLAESSAPTIRFV